MIARLRLRLLAAAATVALAACSTPPTRELPPLPEAWFSAVPAEAGAVDPVALAQWWTAFDDPLLHELVDTALARNLDVQAALTELRLARAGLRQASAALWPVLDGSGQASRQWIDLPPADEAGEGAIDDLLDGVDGRVGLDTWQLALSASWEIDLFGASRLRREAGALRLGAAQAQIVATRIAVAGNLAQGYLQARALLAQMALLDASIENAGEFERVANARFRLGEVTRLDVQAAAAQRARTQAQRGDLEAALAEVVFALDTLTDQPPGTVLSRLGEGTVIPLATSDIPAGQPLDLLRRRPDIIAAAAQLEAGERTALASRRDLFPRLGVSASYGRTGFAVGDAISTTSTLRNVAAQLAFPWFDFAATRAAIDQADAEADSGFVGLRQAIAAALEEVEVANAQLAARQRQRLRRVDALARSDEALHMARRTYEVGLADIDSVLEAQNGQLQAQLDLVDTTLATAVAQVGLYTALGGGWSPAPAAAGGLQAVDEALRGDPVQDRIRRRP